MHAHVYGLHLLQLVLSIASQAHDGQIRMPELNAGDEISLVQVHLGIHHSSAKIHSAASAAHRHERSDRHHKPPDLDHSFPPHGSATFRAVAWVCAAISACLFVASVLYDYWRRKANDSSVEQVMKEESTFAADKGALFGDKSTIGDLLSPVHLQHEPNGGGGLKCPELPTLEEIDTLAESGGVLALVKKLTTEHQNRLAIVDNADNSTLTYGELSAAAENLAQGLEEAGIDEGHIVALFLKPSKTLVIAALGVMHLGAVWLPLDVEAPPARLQQLLEVAGVRLCLGLMGTTKVGRPPLLLLSPDGECAGLNIGPPGYRACPEGVENSSAATLLSSGQEAERAGSQKALPGCSLAAPCPPRSAAVFFTSGSTGAPKGVVYGHEMLLHGVTSMVRLCSMNSASVTVLKSPPHWAVVEYELFPALVTGGTVVCDSRCQKDASVLSQMLAQQGITVLMASGHMLRSLLDGPWSSASSLIEATSNFLRHVVNVGAPLPLDVCDQVQARLQTLQIHNLYGCTESTCTQWTYTPGTLYRMIMKNAPAGMPQQGAEVYVVDHEMQLVDVGQQGEVCLGGAFLSHGYLNDADQTQACFVECPKGGAKMYRTGDIGRWVSDPGQSGSLVLEVIGRVDRQLNLRGVRIAPEEIEAIVMQAPNIKETVVIAAAGSLHAYIEGQGDDLVEQVGQFCEVRLSAQMRPSLIQHVTLPRHANGKIDVQELTIRAQKDAKQVLFESVDSLGVARQSNQSRIVEEDVFGAARSIAMAAIFLWHWYWIWIPGVQNLGNPVPVNIFSTPSVDAFSRNIPFSWLRMWLSGFLGFEWSTQVFIISAAYQHRKQWEEKTAGLIQDLWILALFFILWWPAGTFFQFVLRGLQNTDIDVDMVWTSQIRWFLLCLLWCRCLQYRVLEPFESALLRWSNRYVARAGQAFFVLSWWMLAMAYLGWRPNVCPNMNPRGFAFKAMRRLDVGVLNPRMIEDPNPVTYCTFILHPFQFHCVALYMTAWYYARPLVDWAKTRRWLFGCGPIPLPWGLLFTGQVFFFGYLSMHGFVVYESNLMFAVSCLMSITLLISLVQWRCGRWIVPRILAKSGHYCVGTCCFHVFMICTRYCSPVARIAREAAGCVEKGVFFFSFRNKELLPGPMHMMEILAPYGGFAQFVALAVYPCAFSLLVGEPLQSLCFRALKATQHYMLQVSRVDALRWAQVRKFLMTQPSAGK